MSGAILKSGCGASFDRPASGGRERGLRHPQPEGFTGAGARRVGEHLETPAGLEPLDGAPHGLPFVGQLAHRRAHEDPDCTISHWRGRAESTIALSDSSLRRRLAPGADPGRQAVGCGCLLAHVDLRRRRCIVQHRLPSTQPRLPGATAHRSRTSVRARRARGAHTVSDCDDATG